MICKLYGNKDYTHFKIEWKPLLYMLVEKGHVFNLAHIMSFNILNSIKAIKEALKGINLGFLVNLSNR